MCFSRPCSRESVARIWFVVSSTYFSFHFLPCPPIFAKSLCPRPAAAPSPSRSASGSLSLPTCCRSHPPAHCEPPTPSTSSRCGSYSKNPACSSVIPNSTPPYQLEDRLVVQPALELLDLVLVLIQDVLQSLDFLRRTNLIPSQYIALLWLCRLKESFPYRIFPCSSSTCRAICRSNFNPIQIYHLHRLLRAELLLPLLQHLGYLDALLLYRLQVLLELRPRIQSPVVVHLILL